MCSFDAIICCWRSTKSPSRACPTVPASCRIRNLTISSARSRASRAAGLGASGTSSGGPAATSARPPEQCRLRLAARPPSFSIGDPRHTALSGTQVQAIGLLGGLVRAGAGVTVALTAELHPTVSRRASAGSSTTMRFVGGDRRVGDHQALDKPAHSSHCTTSRRITLEVADHVVLTPLDMILGRAPAYRRSREKSEKQRATTAAALASVDQIGFPVQPQPRWTPASDGRAGARPRNRRPLQHQTTSRVGGCPIPARPLVAAPSTCSPSATRSGTSTAAFALRLVGWLRRAPGIGRRLVLAGGPS